jgi:branched-chain amino acid transport system permease protein
MGELYFGIELLVAGMANGLMYSLVALGFVLIYKASSVFNFAQGAMTLFAALTVVGFMPQLGLFGAVAATAVVMCVVALGAERIVFRPLLGSSQLTIFMGTVGFASILEGAAQMVWGTRPRSLALGIPADPIEIGHVLVSKTDLVAAAVAAALVAAIVLFFQRTRIGLGLRAIADDPAAAGVVGIPLNKVWAVAWALAGMVAIASGMLWGSRIGVHFAMSLIALKALPVLIIGGIDSVVGVIVAGLIVGAAEALGEGYIGTHIGGGVQDVAAYVVALLFLIVKPSGLFGQAAIQRL